MAEITRDEVMKEYEELYEVIKDSDDSLWPNWLFNPSFNDFGDDYYRLSFVDDETTSKVKGLKRRYNDYFEYVDAMVIYNEYMEKMIDKYGSIRIIKNSIELGTLDDPIPSKPKLKSTRKNKQFLQAGVLPSRKYPTAVSSEDIFAIARQIYPNAFGKDIDEADDKLTKEQKKKYAEIQKDIEAANRRKNLYRSVGNNRGTDFILEYLNQAKSGHYSSTSISIEDSGKTITQIMKEMEKEANTREELLDEEGQDSTVVIAGRLVSRREQAKTEIYKELYKEGFDILHNLGRSGMSKQSVKMIRSEIGATEPLSKKELKKIKKQAKKDEERIRRRKDSNSLLESVLLNNKLDHGTRDENGNIAFRLRDMYRD